ncbi:hypothetical protein RJ55_02082 [Drechmeria coniospora]|nr:hypothetical protein RJ55_02082 [Drechmeria coniospora]
MNANGHRLRLEMPAHMQSWTGRPGGPYAQAAGDTTRARAGPLRVGKVPGVPKHDTLDALPRGAGRAPAAGPENEAGLTTTTRRNH